jgi:basic membrane protein A and related proteins
MRRRTGPALALAATAALLGAGCAKSTGTSATESPAGVTPGTGGTAVGFIMVGPKDDYGYNQAVYEAAQSVGLQYPDLKMLTSENIPETSEAVRAMEDLIAKGAKIIFATSYGHSAMAEEVAKKHPEVVVVHQGGLIKNKAPNYGTYFGTVYEPVYMAGIAAGAASKTGKLGYVVAVPIPQTLANVNAFELGAKVSNPSARTTVVFTANWCDPAKQAQAADSLIGQGVDVLTQHQDCTKTIVEKAEAAGKMTVGYHSDTSKLAPKGWITGSEWNWAPLYGEIIKAAKDGTFTGSKYNADYREGLRTGSNPFVQSAFGPMVDDATMKKITEAETKLKADGSPFTGPVKDQEGAEKVPAGKTPSYADVEQMDYLVEGVDGKIPAG